MRDSLKHWITQRTLNNQVTIATHVWLTQALNHTKNTEQPSNQRDLRVTHSSTESKDILPTRHRGNTNVVQSNTESHQRHYATE